MATKRISKEAAIAVTTTFTQQDTGLDQPNPNFPNCYIDVISLNALGGSPVIPAAGTYTVWVKTDIDGGWKTVGVIAASEAAGSAGLDGAAAGLTFVGLPEEFKVVPAGITTATHYRAIIKQVSSL